ncbi:MAG TPA: YbhB/YbcL family Raf kinase inhibitor-like protein [Phycisphaerae bacterium]|nr:YbhB/YbcL family Raf kinase inhibitor-like protein [Phycisphaerae bacterium]
MVSSRLPVRLAIVVALAALVAGCERSTSEPQSQSEQKQRQVEQDGTEHGATGESAMTLTIESPAFALNTKMPQRFTGDGGDASPALIWSRVPENAKELALICDDPDAPTPQPWVHWVIYKIPPTAKGLPENVAKTESPPEPAGAMQGTNSWGRFGYGGPAPPRGPVHHYHFKLYALDAPLDLSPGRDKKHLLAAMEGHILAQGELVGTYQR